MGQTSVWEHLLSPPKFTLNYDVTSLHNCDFGKLLIFFIMQSRHLSIFPEDPRKQSPGSSVSWEWAHSWALREHPGLGGGNVLKWKLQFTLVEHVLISICLSLMTHHSLQTHVYFTFCTYRAQFNTFYFLSCHISMFLLSFPSISALLSHSI